MLKLKILNKPRMLKMKCTCNFPSVVLANFQEKEVNPTKEVQEVKPDIQYDGLSKVTVNAIPNEYVIPSGNIEITENGTYNVIENANAIVNVPEKQLGTKTITKNGTYKATDDNLDGYSEVNVETSGVDINDYFRDTLTAGTYGYPGYLTAIKKIKSPLTISGSDASRMFLNSQLDELPMIDTSSVKNMNSMFQSSKTITLDLSSFNTSNVTDMGYMFYYSQATTLDLSNFDTSKVENINGIFSSCYDLTNIIGCLQNLGQAYNTSQSANYSSYTLSLSDSNSLTHDSLMNIINNLYDIKTKGCNAQKLILGSTNVNKLTSEEIAIATEKGWTIS